MGGGIGHSDTTLSALIKPFILLVLAVLVITTLGLSEPAVAELTGDGSPDNPYSGHVTELYPFAFYTVGTSFDAYLEDGERTIVDDDYLIGSGLYAEDNHLRGTLSATGIFIANEGSTKQYVIVSPHSFDEYGWVDTSNYPAAGAYEDLAPLGFGGADDVYFDNLGNGHLPDEGYIGELADGGIMDENGYKMFSLYYSHSAYAADYWMCLANLPEELRTSITENTTVEEDSEYVGTVHVSTEEFFNLKSTMIVPTIFVNEGKISWKIIEVKETYEEYASNPVPTPTKEGFTFTGWYEDPECTIPWEFMTAQDWLDLNGDFSGMNPARFIYAGWEPLESHIAATDGSGTKDDPYSGTISHTNVWDWAYIPPEIYVEVGSTFDVVLSTTSLTNVYEVDSPLYLETLGRNVNLKGDVTEVGDCELICNGELVTTFHFVQTTSELVFISSPSDEQYATITYVKT